MISIGKTRSDSDWLQFSQPLKQGEFCASFEMELLTYHGLVVCSHDLILPRKSMNKVLKLKWGESLKEESLFKRAFQILSPA